MKKKILARFFSYIFHPVLFFLIMPFFIVYKETASGLYAIKWMIFSSVFILFGVMIILFETIEGDFSDFDISKKGERFKFYIILAVLGLVYFSLSLFFKGIFFPLSLISLSILLGIIVFAFVNRFVKASIHTAVIFAFVISMSLMYGVTAFLLSFWMIPLVAWARIYEKKHTAWEVLLGGFLGSIITLITFSVGKAIL